MMQQTLSIRGVTMRLRLLTVAAIVTLAVVASYVFWSQPNAGQTTEHIVIVIASIVEIQPIAELREGFKETIAQSQIADRVEFVERNAQGENRLMSQIAAEVSRLRPNAIYVLGTPLAQAIQKQNPEILLLQGAVTDPVGADLADSWEGSGRMYAATSDRPPVERILDTIKELVPERKKLGVIYNPGESNSVAVVEALRAIAEPRGFSLQEYGVSAIQDLPTTITAALARSEILFIPPDNMVTSGLKAVIQSAAAKSVPVFATTADAVELGALASVTTDFRQLGRETAEIAIRILVEDEDAATIPIQLPKKQQIIVNSQVAQALGISVSSARSAGYLIQ